MMPGIIKDEIRDKVSANALTPRREKNVDEGLGHFVLG